MDNTVDASDVIARLTARIGQLEYDKAVLEAVNEQNQQALASRAQEHPVPVVTDLPD